MFFLYLGTFNSRQVNGKDASGPYFTDNCYCSIKFMDSPVNNRTLLLSCSLRSPQVSYAIVGDSRNPARCIGKRPSSVTSLVAGPITYLFLDAFHQALAFAFLARRQLVALALVGVIARLET